MRWQRRVALGGDVCDTIELADGKGLFIERFELICLAATSEQSLQPKSTQG